MKRIIISCLVLTLFANVSCERELDQFSNTNTFVDAAFKTSSDYRFALDGIYDAMKSPGYFSGDSGNQNILADLTSDNLIQSPTGRLTNNRAWLLEFGSDDGQTTTLYGAAYFAISRANFVLENLNKGILSPAETLQVEAEARALRGILHFDIARAYCKIPTQSTDANNSLGIAYMTTTSNNPVTRDLNVAQVYDKIINDLEFAKTNIPTTNSTPAPFSKGRLNKAAVAGLLSRVYLFKGDKAKALSAAEESITLSPSVGSINNFPLVWNSTNQDGTLFEILNSDAERVTMGVSYNQIVGGAIRSEFVLYRDFYNLYKDTDIRKNTYFQVSAYSGQSYVNVIKYNTRGSLPNVVNYKYLRTAEVYLNGAEAAFDSNPARALALLNILRQSRYSDYTPLNITGTALWDEIQKERRLELMGEADRWYTLKRLGLGLTRPNQGALSSGGGSPAPTLMLSSTSDKWQWPIPIEAININPGIKQNPGY
ncbi:RagB/SusD family nutrient uptake outer membrane protein [Chryseobacterium sp. PMSZPI]|uniref:RagB/SusD family nutrient uptake outer membrane protein n=1 Tax=Chryseobacterium sp. PMSZPI TaxID=1033900 RepID=UPI000C3399A4|nr:RagB/SusD family nutrient uptake outer membrane protein [Chryseobacterium sp. PMSZPI]PKF74083.1 RagB/SusD family nutrient uptake outer membrane protein [Chryseobacterium sp. PMSZPI]